MYKLARRLGRAIGFNRWLHRVPGASTALGLYMLASHRDSALNRRGWFQSMQAQSPLSKNGEPIPWLSYPAIDLLTDRIQDPSIRVFEYGAGNSTLWWSERSALVHSVEHDQDWVDRLVPYLPDNAHVHFQGLSDVESYVGFATTLGETFDVVVIDGRKRSLCAQPAQAVLSERGVIVWDNSERQDYQPALDQLGIEGFRRLDLWGLSAAGVVESCTTILYRDGNLLAL